MEEIRKETQKYLRACGIDVFMRILYPALKHKFEEDGTYEINYLVVCQRYPEYAEKAESDNSKRTRLSKAKAILRNGWEREALKMITESKRIDRKLIKMAEEYLMQLDQTEERVTIVKCNS